MKGIIGIDIGTTHIKTGLFSDEGNMLQLETAATPLRHDGRGEVCPPQALWGLVGRQMENIRKGAACEITGIVVTGMAEAGLIIDRVGKCEASDILLWYDARTEGLAGKMSGEEEAEVFSRTGLRDSFKYGIYKFLWLLNEKGIEREGAVWLSVCDYIIWKLTGRTATDPSFAARTYVYDIVDGCWDLPRIRSFGLAEDNFPRVVPSGTVVGETCLEGIGQVPVAVGGHDHVCAAFGLLRGSGVRLCDSAGTSETFLGFMENMPEGGFAYDSGILYGPSVEKGWFFMTSIPSSGHSVEWFRRKLQQRELDYGEMNRHLEQAAPGPTGILYYPYLTGSGCPFYRPESGASIWGLREDMDLWVVLKGILEGIQYQAAWILEVMQEAGADVGGDLVCAGGAVRNRTLMQIKADILNRRVSVPKIYEATLWGAVLLFLRKNGGESHVGFTEYEEIYTPCRQRAEKYKEIRKDKYMVLVESLKKLQ